MVFWHVVWKCVPFQGFTLLTCLPKAALSASNIRYIMFRKTACQAPKRRMSCFKITLVRYKQLYIYIPKYILLSSTNLTVFSKDYLNSLSFSDACVGTPALPPIWHSSIVTPLALSMLRALSASPISTLRKVTLRMGLASVP